MRAEHRAQEDELAVALHDVVAHLGIVVAGIDALAHEDAQVLGERRVGIVDRLVLADEAAQIGRYGPRPLLQHRIAQDLVRLDGLRARAGEQHENSDEGSAPHRAYSAGTGAGVDLARAGAPILRRRSLSDTAPPAAITTAPIQISRTSGL
jgi:hypothetical protein